MRKMAGAVHPVLQRRRPNAMKKLFTAAFLSLMLLSWDSGKASAWNWPWKCCCGRCYDFSICCKQYNAFTPICFGKMSCNGCCPSPEAYGAGGGMGNGMPPFGAAYGNGGGQFGGSQFLGELPPPEAGVPPTFNAPMPSPVDGANPGAGANSNNLNPMPAGAPAVQPSGYRGLPPSGYAVPVYNPATGTTQMYWYGNRGY